MAHKRYCGMGLLWTVTMLLMVTSHCSDTIVQSFQNEVSTMLKSLRADIVEPELKARLQYELIELYKQLLNFHDNQIQSDHKIANQARIVLSLVAQMKQSVRRSINNVKGGRNLVVGDANKIEGRGNAVKGDANMVVGGSNISLGSDNVMVGEGARISGNGGFIIGKDISLKGQDCVVFSSQKKVQRDSKLIVNDYALDIAQPSAKRIAIQRLKA